MKEILLHARRVSALRTIAALVVAVAVMGGAAFAVVQVTRGRAAVARAEHSATAIDDLRLDTARVGAVRWEQLAEAGPNLTLENEMLDLSARLRDAARRVGSGAGAPGAQARSLAAVLADAATEAGTPPRRGTEAAARRHSATVLDSTTRLLDPALNGADQSLGERRRVAERHTLAALVFGTSGALLVVTLLLLMLWRGARRARAFERDTLRRSEERFRALVQHGSEVVAVLDPEAKVSFVTPSAAWILGLDPEGLIGRRLTDSMEPGERERVLAFLATLAGQPAGSHRITEFLTPGADGQTLQLEVLGANLLDHPQVGGLVLNVRDISERKALEEELRHQAFHDPLTGLANRALFEDRVQHALSRTRRGGGDIAVLFIDLDDFKLVNDSRGHGAGDNLLVQVAAAVSETVRGPDTIARLGGDEFAVLLEEAAGEEEALATAHRILKAIARPVELHDGRQLTVRASLGVAVVTAAVLDTEQLLRNADIAMYAAKASGKGGVQRFRPEMLTAARAQLDLREDLRAALAGGQLRLDYQPIIDMASRDMIAVEALLRWDHPVHGAIPPADFIPLAEQTALIVSIGRWVLQQACADLAVWQDTGSAAAKLGIAVNVSPVQLAEDGFATDVRDIVAAGGIAPERVTLELTETVLAASAQRTATTLQRLRGYGFSIAVDDFGTGYSSLSHLQRFAVDTVKIDRSFVRGLPALSADTALVRSMVELAGALGLQTVAEGIEREDQLEAIRETGCDFGQGYLFARPMPADRVAALLAANDPATAEQRNAPARFWRSAAVGG